MSCRNSDILIGALDENDLINQYYFASRPYHYDVLTWCVQERKKIARWKSFFLTCHDPIVIALACFLMTTAVYVTYIFQQFEDFQPKWDSLRIAINFICCSVGLTTKFPAKTIPNRIFIATVMYCSIVYTTILVSFTLNAIRDPQLENQITSIKEIINKESPYQLIGDGFALQHLLRQNEVDFSKQKTDVCEIFGIC